MDDFGLVICGNGVDYTVLYHNKEILARLRGKLLHKTKRSHHPVCAGDHVRIIEQQDGSYFLDSVLKRKNKISRPSNLAIRKEQAIVANIDFIFIIGSVYSPPLNTGFIDRLLIYCEMQEIEPYIVINKVDHPKTKVEQEIIKAYSEIGYKVIETSVNNNFNIDKIEALTKDKITAFIGNSGVGKSSILNALDSSIKQKVSSTSKYSLKGRHTTKQARLFRLKNSGYLIDTPGIREFGLWNLTHKELKNYYRDFRKYDQDCKFSNCLHINEPVCQIKKEVERGKIAKFRYENYLKTYQSLFENKDIYFND